MRASSSAAEVRLRDGFALHARPAGKFVKLAASFASDISVEVDGRRADAKSILAVLALGARNGAVLSLTAEGPDAEEALMALAAHLAQASD